MSESLYTGITVQGLYSDQTGDQLFGVVGTAVPASIIYIGGKDNNGNLAPLSLGSNGYLNVNASVSAPSDNIETGSLTTAAGTLAVSTAGTSALMLQIEGTWTGTINFQCTKDGGNSWEAIQLYPLPTPGGQEGSPSVSSTTANGQWTLPVGGIQQFRVQSAGLATGTANVYITAGQGQYSVFTYSDNQANFLATSYQGGAWSVGVTGTVAVTQSTSPWLTKDAADGTPGAAAPGTAIQVAGSDGTDLRVLLTSATGQLHVITDTGSTTTVTGTVAVTQSTSPWIVAGNKTNNNAAPNGTNVGVLPAQANAAAQTWTEGNAVVLSVDLGGWLRTKDIADGASGAAVPSQVTQVGGSDGTNLWAIPLTTGGTSVKVSPTAPSDTTNSGTITSTQNVAVSTQGASTVGIQVSGTWTGTLNFQASADGTTWFALQVYPISPWTGGTESTTANGEFTAPVGGYQQVRVLGATVATGTANIYLDAAEGNQTVYIKSLVANDVNVTAQQGGAPWSQNLTEVAGVTLGGTAVTNFGTAPAAAAVPGVNASIYAGTTGLSATGSSLNVNVTGSSTVTVAGNLTNNNAVPGAANVGVLPALAATSYTTNTYTNGFQVLPVTDLHGAANEDLQAWAGTALGTPTNFGTTPGAVVVGQVNASIFQGTAAISTANPLFTNISDGTNALTANAITAWGTAPTGHVLGVNAEMFVGNNAVSATAPVPVSATAAANTSGNPIFVSAAVTGNVTVVGTLTNNNAAPTTTNVGVLPALAVAGTFPAVTTPTYTAGDQELVTVSQGGSLVTIPADEEYASHISYYSVDTGATLKTVPNATVYPLVSIQANSASIQFIVREVQGFTDGSQELIQLIKNPQTLTGANFVTTGIPTGSHIKIDTSATAVTIGTGVVVWSGFAATNPVTIQNLLSSLAAGAPGDTYTVACQKFGTGTSKAGGQIFWSETAAAV